MKTKDGKNKVDDMEIIVLRSLEEIEEVRPIWEEMQHSEPYPVINADIDQYVSVIKAIGDDVRPHVILMKQNGHLAVMLIARVEKHRLKLKFGYKTLVSPRLRCLTIEYGGVIGQPTTELCALLIRELMKLLHQGEINMIWFNNIKTDSPLYRFSKTTPGFLCRDWVSKANIHRSMTIPENIQLFYQARTTKHRKHLRQYINKLEKAYPGQVKMVTYLREEELDIAINDAAYISSKTYQYAMEFGLVDNFRTRTLLSTAAKLGWLRMSVLYIDSQPCVFQLGKVFWKR
jgi:hypothetical protein